MGGICKYPERVCPHMVMFKGTKYCESTPCQINGELPKSKNADLIHNMNYEDLAEFLLEFNACKVCKQYDKNTGHCNVLSKFLCTKEYEKLVIYEWLKQPVEDK